LAGPDEKIRKLVCLGAVLSELSQAHSFSRSPPRQPWTQGSGSSPVTRGVQRVAPGPTRRCRGRGSTGVPFRASLLTVHPLLSCAAAGVLSLAFMVSASPHSLLPTASLAMSYSQPLAPSTSTPMVGRPIHVEPAWVALFPRGNARQLVAVV
jgi:hypothetical protein